MRKIDVKLTVKIDDKIYNYKETFENKEDGDIIIDINLMVKLLEVWIEENFGRQALEWYCLKPAY